MKKHERTPSFQDDSIRQQDRDEATLIASWSAGTLPYEQQCG